jgi:[protein-PII] uridylyltransferase
VHEYPFCSQLIANFAQPWLIYIAALFHDIAKGRGGDHSQLGEGIALEFCLQHGLSISDAKRVAWLVRQHLLMSMTAKRKDISDPDVIHSFALAVGSIEALNYLYLLTVADIRATNPSLWSAWKDSLLKDLYIATHSALHRGLENRMAREQRIAENTEEARATLQVHGLSTNAIQNAWQHMGDDYFLRYSADEIVWHTLAIAAAPEDALPLVLVRPKTQRGSADIFIYTHDASGIFSICSATIDQLGLTILDARIMTTADHYVLNSFQVLEQSGEMIKDLHREQHICSSLRQAFTPDHS